MIRNIALPVLGAGDQGIETEYVAVPLFHQCRNMFSTIPSLCTIDFYELNPVRAEKLNRILLTLMPQENHPGKEVFISYSSKQTVRAHMLHDTLTRDGFSVWIAPEGIPAGNDYLDEIPAAISDANAVVMMMTLDSLSSYWVRREVTCAIDAGKFILPVQLVPFELTQKIRFMFDADQIMPVADLSEPEQDAMISGRLREKVRN